MPIDPELKNTYVNSMPFPRKVYRWYRYSKVFGKAYATKAIFELMRPFGAYGELNLPGYSAPFKFRTGTCDVPSITKVLFELEYAHELPADPKFIIDAGANIGSASIYFANLYPNAKILAVEPDPANFELLQENASHYKNITVLHGGVWSQSTYLSISNVIGNTDAFQVHESNTPTDIRAYSIPELKRIAGMDYVDILKVDIEGSEAEVFSRDSQTWLNAVGLIQIELHDRLVPKCASSFYKAIADFDYFHEIKGENTIVRFSIP